MVPKLRFNETKNTTYSTVTLGDIVQSISSGRSKDCVENGNYKFYGSTGIIGFRSTADYEGTAILIARVGANAGSLYMVSGKYNVSDNTLIVSADTQFINFLYFYLSAINLNNLVYGSGQPLITGGMLKNLKIDMPGTKEQTKIADFLSSVDEKITLLNKQYDLLCQYKKGMMQKIFNQKIRFKNKDGSDFLDWKTVKLSECLYEHKRRNKKLIYNKEQVLSVSGDVGIVNQIELLGRSYAGESVENYHIVHRGDIVYTKSPLKGNPYGIIKSNKGTAGIVSTLYAVYSCRDCIDHNYIDYYFSRREVVNNYLKPLVNKGAKNDMKVNNQHVLTGDIVLPFKEEQEKIVSLLSMLDGKIAVKKAELDKLKTWKHGLLQQMFV